eukprot:6205346-Pleurochrysis_carterae.AAC.1
MGGGGAAGRWGQGPRGKTAGGQEGGRGGPRGRRGSRRRPRPTRRRRGRQGRVGGQAVPAAHLPEDRVAREGSGSGGHAPGEADPGAHRRDYPCAWMLLFGSCHKGPSACQACEREAAGTAAKPLPKGALARVKAACVPALRAQMKA